MSNACPQRKYRPNIPFLCDTSLPGIAILDNSRPSHAPRNFILPSQTQVWLVRRSFRPWCHSMKALSSKLTLSCKSDNLKPRNSSVAEQHEKNETKKKKLWKESFASKKVSKIEVWGKLNKYRKIINFQLTISKPKKSLPYPNSRPTSSPNARPKVATTRESCAIIAKVQTCENRTQTGNFLSKFGLIADDLGIAWFRSSRPIIFLSLLRPKMKRKVEVGPKIWAVISLRFVVRE
jgi:hypothetical protein